MKKIPKVVFQRTAEADVDGAAIYYAMGNIEIAFEFLDALEDTARLLADMPELGTKRPFEHAEGLRMWPIHKFDKYLIFYRPTEVGIEIVRVLHASRDIPRLF